MPGHGASTSSSRASLSARTVRRSLGPKCDSEPAPTAVVAVAVADLDLALDDEQVRPFVDLVLLELLPGGQADRDCTALLV